MVKNIKYAGLGALLMTAACASAQTLSTEITVDRIVEPAQREAFRPAWAPQTLPIPQHDVSLLPAEYAKPGMIVNTMSTMPAAMLADTVAHTPYKGYASVGYFPLANFGANAGYRFVENGKASAGAWMQLDSRKFTRQLSGGDATLGQQPWQGDADQQTTILNVGADAAYNANSHSRLGLDLGMMYANVLHPGMPAAPASSESRDNWRQGALQFSAGLAWQSHPGRLAYSLSAGFEHFGFADPSIQLEPGSYKDKLSSQAIAQLGLGLGLCRDHESAPWLGIEIDATYAKSSLGVYMSYGEHSGYADFGFTRFQSALLPYVQLGSKAFKARLGLNASLGHVVGICPDVRLSWAPARLPLSAYLNFTGQQAVVNRLSEYFAIDPFLSPYQQMEITRTNWRADIGAGVGPVAGFSLQGFASVAKSSSYRPSHISFGGGTLFESSPTISWMAGARISYAYKTWGKATASFALASSDGEDFFSWYEWKDNAKSQAKIEIEAYPMDKLTVSASCLWRGNRRIYRLATNINPYKPSDLGDICDLALRAAYQITPQLSAFAQAQNLLNRRYLTISGLPGQGVNGLMGIAYKF